MKFSAEDLSYVISLEEIGWGLALIGITMTLHGCGMLIAMNAGNRVVQRLDRHESYVFQVIPIVLVSWIIVLVHLVEALVWSGFFLLKDAMPNHSIAFYFSLMEYTTVGSAFNLPLRWRLLEGMIAIAGLLCFAWSTGVLFTLAQDFQKRQFEARQRRKTSK